MGAARVVAGFMTGCIGLSALVAIGPALSSRLPDSWRSLARAAVPVEPGRYVEREDPGLTPRRATVPFYSPPEGLFESHELGVDGETRRWWSLGDGAPDRPGAILVLLHGSGRDGRAMLDMWRHLDVEPAPLLVAPDSLDPAVWSWSTDGPGFIAAVIADAERVAGVSGLPVYLFGHSAGGGQAVGLANADPGRWTAVATHAAALSPGFARSAPDAPPVRLYVGARDATVPPDGVRVIAQELSAAGHDAELVVIPDHDHWYYVIGPALARDAWAFLAGADRGP